MRGTIVLNVMRRALILGLTLTAAVSWAANPLVITSAASTTVGVAPDSLASIFGDSISTETMSSTAPWPTTLGDISVVWVTDSANNKQMAGILFVSSSQMNIYIPPGLAAGPATIAFPTTGLAPGVGTAALRNIAVNIQKTAPGLFSLSGTGSGVAAATAVRVVIPTQIQSPVPVFTCTPQAPCKAVPIDVGLDAPVYVSLYGTGIRNAASVTVTVGTTVIQPTYAGPQGQVPGMDQVNFGLPLSLRGSGTVNVVVTADGVASNPVQLAIQ